MAIIKVGNNSIGKISVIEPYDDPIGYQEIQTTPWVRPSEWLDMPVYSSGDDKVAILAFVPSGLPMQARIELFGTYISNEVRPTLSTVDWGDGNSVAVSGTDYRDTYPGYVEPAVHTYSYDDLSSDTEFEYNGRICRQAMIEITNASGMYYLDLSDFAATNNKTDPDSYGRASVSHNYLELSINSSGCENVYLRRHPPYRGSPRHCKKIKIRSDKSITNGQTFWQLYELEELDIESGIFRDLTSFNYMFADCRRLKSVPYFDTSSATSMGTMFNGCWDLEEIPDFDTSNVTSFGSFASYCYNLKKIPNIDFSNATNLNNSFFNCTTIKSIPSGMNISNAQNLAGCFQGCTNLSAVPDNLDFSSATTTDGMFRICSNLKRCPDLYLPNVTDMDSMFNGCSTLKVSPSIDAPVATNASRVFMSCYGIRKAGFINIPSATDISYFFNDCYNLQNAEFGSMTGVQRLDGAFADCHDLNTLKMNSIENALPTHTLSMLENCKTIKRVPTINTSNCLYTYSMYLGCNSLQEIPEHDLSNVINCSYMFRGCGLLVNFGGVTNFSSVATNINGMFQDTPVSELPSSIFTSGFPAGASAQSFAWGTHVEYIPVLNISGVTDIDYISYSPFRSSPLKGIGTLVIGDANASNTFNTCEWIQVIPSADASNAQSLTNFCYNANSLTWSDLYNVNKTISYYACYLGSGAIEHIFNNLSTVSSETIDIRYNYGTKELHPDTIAVATSKGWTVTT